MSVDRGGLDYKITTDYDATGVEVFKLDIKALREEINGLKKDLSFKAVQVKIDRGDSVAELKKSKQAIKEEAEELSRSEKALRNYVAALEARLIKQEEANVALEFSFELEKTSRSANEQARAAQDKLTKTLDKRGEAEARIAAAQERGIALTEQEQKALGILAEANIKLLAAKNKLASVQSDSGNAELRSIQARTRAMQELNAQNLARQTQLERIKLGLADPFPGSKLDQKEAAIKISAQAKEDLRLRLAAQGLGVDGKPLPVPPTVEQLADKIKLNAKNKEDLKQFLAAQGLGPDGKPLAIPLSPADKARNLILKAEEKDAINKLLLAQGRGPNGSPLPPTPPDPGFSDRVKNFLGLGEGADNAEKAGSRALFTFRRLIGIFAVFTAARAVVRGFFGLVGDAIAFNSQIEQTTLGIAALTTAVGTVKSATGQAVSASESFALAQQEARRQTQLLRQEAVAAAVSFSAAVNAFQVGIAPGLRAGLNLDQVRQFAIQIAQAAKTLELADNQLAEEIRSILAGTIQARTTRIATALGITNDDIRRAKELGTLSELLTTKFKAFNSLSDAIGSTFEGAMARVKTAAELAIQQSSVGFFGELKGLLNDVLKLLSDGSAAVGKFKPSPEAVSAFKILFDALQNVISRIRVIVSSAGLKGIVPLVKALAGAIEVAGSVLIGVFQGAIIAAQSILSVLDAVKDAVQSIAAVLPFDLPSLNTTANVLARILGTFVLLRLVLVSIPGLTIGLFTALPGALAITRAILSAVTSIRTAAAFSGIALGGVAVTVGLIGTLIAGVAFIVGGVLNKLGLLPASFNKIFSRGGEVSRTVDDFGDRIKEVFNFKPQIELAAESLAKFDEEMRKLTEDTEKLNIESSTTSFDSVLGISHFKLQGKALEEAKLGLQRYVAVFEASKEKERERISVTQGIASAVQQQLTAQERLIELGKKGGLTEFQSRFALEGIVELYDLRIKKEQELQTLLKGGSEEQKKALADLDKPGTDQTAALEIRKKITDEIKAQTEQERKNLDIINRVLQERLAEVSDNKELQLAFAQAAAATIDAQGRQITLQGTLNTIVEAQKRQQLAINEQYNIRLALLAREATIQLETANKVAAAKAKDNKDQLEARLRFANQAQQDAVAAQGALDTLRVQQAIEQESRNAQLAALEKMVTAKRAERDALQKTVADLESRKEGGEQGLNPQIVTAIDHELAAREALNQLIAQQNGLLEENTILQQEATTALAAAVEKQRILNIKQAEGIGEVRGQIHLALQELVQQLPTQFEFIFDTLRGTITSFASFASSAITDAFDPSKTVDLKERFGRFLQGIAQQILQTLFQIAATKAALGLVTLFGFSTGGEVPALGRARGGPVPGRRRAQGLAGGGRAPHSPYHGRRPPGLDSRDTVPIWARPGEWFVAPERSSLLGNDFMHQLAFGNVNPDALRAAAGLFGAPVVAAPSVASGPGFAAGGFVSPTTSRVATPSTPTGLGTQGPLPAYIVGGPQTVERFLRSGSAAAIAFFEEQGFRRN